jgi:hypothetical protein
MRAFLLAAGLCLLLAAPAQAATVTNQGGVLRVQAAPGEQNDVWVSDSGVQDQGAPLQAGPGCDSLVDFGAVSCPGATRVEADLGDLSDRIRVESALPTDTHGGEGDDELYGGPVNDVLSGDSGSDFADGGEGDDQILLRDRLLDTALCGGGRDRVRAEVLDSLDYACEVVDLGPPGRVGRLRPSRHPKRFVKVPGRGGEKVDRRILANVVYLIRRYKVRVVAGYARRGHKASGEHPLGLATDLVPGPGGSWRKVDRLAKWAEPRQNRPRMPFRWVGYNGDKGHGRGNHLHLSWQHRGGRFGRPAPVVWAWQVKRR